MVEGTSGQRIIHTVSVPCSGKEWPSPANRCPLHNLQHWDHFSSNKRSTKHRTTTVTCHPSLWGIRGRAGGIGIPNPTPCGKQTSTITRLSDGLCWFFVAFSLPPLALWSFARMWVCVQREKRHPKSRKSTRQMVRWRLTIFTRSTPTPNYHGAEGWFMLGGLGLLRSPHSLSLSSDKITWPEDGRRISRFCRSIFATARD